ncbi:hypothetical protein V6O07_07940, partial [Arthrospira platensis SPKY2]
MVGIGAAVAINTVSSRTAAWIGEGADITADGVAVRSFMTDIDGDEINSFEASAKAGAGGGKVGIAGALALNVIDVQSTAEISRDASIDANGGDVKVSAHGASETTATALPDEPATGGKVGVGASVALNLFTND